jgi:hypothetical protein
MRSAFLILLVGLIALGLEACGGQEEQAATATPTPAPTATPTLASQTIAAATTVAAAEDRREVEALLRAAALRLEDLPSGFTLDEEKFTTNEQEAEGGSAYSGGPTLEDLNRFGRILGYEADYSQEVSLGSLLGGTLFLQATTVVYRDSAGARDAFEFVRQRTSDPELAKAFEASVAGSAGEVRDASISPMSFAEVGDDRIAFEMKFTMHDPDLNVDFDYVVQLVGIRRGRGIGSVTVLAITSPSPVQELEELARTSDERLRDALE